MTIEFNTPEELAAALERALKERRKHRKKYSQHKPPKNPRAVLAMAKHWLKHQGITGSPKLGGDVLEVTLEPHALLSFFGNPIYSIYPHLPDFPDTTLYVSSCGHVSVNGAGLRPSTLEALQIAQRAEERAQLVGKGS